MKTKITKLLLLIALLPANTSLSSPKIPLNTNPAPDIIVKQQIRFNPNNIDAWIWNSGIFDQDVRTSNTPGFQWPIGTGKFAIFTAGLSTGAMVNGGLRLASASYSGEYAPGYVLNSSGPPVAMTDSTFRFYKVKRGDNMNNNYDWLMWGRMVPYGAPYIDVNQNGSYEPAVDTPGIRGAVQTIFLCLTDGFPENHTNNEGFSGGTPPMFAELHMTAWGYDNPGYQDMIFKRFILINKNDTAWNGTYTAITADPDLGDVYDDYVGCDTTLSLGFCYNSDNIDGTGSGVTYGANPPAVGFKWLCNNGINIPMNSFTYFTNPSTIGPVCENDPSAPEQAYNYLKGIKRDGTPWVIPPGGNQQYITKFCYSGDPAIGTGWTEGSSGYPHGSIENCGGPGVLTGTYVSVNAPGDRRMVMSLGSDNYNVASGDTIKITLAELIARGTNNLNSITLLKQLSNRAQALCNAGFIIGVNNISTSVPGSFTLYQNYPNPFNPATKIKFEIPLSRGVSEGRGVLVRLIIYDVIGKEIATLVSEKLKAGTYEAEWDASNYPSGVYFYKLVTDNYTETKKMVLLK